MLLPPNHQNTKGHKILIFKWRKFVKILCFWAFVAFYDFLFCPQLKTAIFIWMYLSEMYLKTWNRGCKPCPTVRRARHPIKTTKAETYIPLIRCEVFLTHLWWLLISPNFITLKYAFTFARQDLEDRWEWYKEQYLKKIKTWQIKNKFSEILQ